MKTLLLIDGFNHVFRAYHAMQRLGLETFDGMPTGAIYGFLNMINRLDKDLEYSAVAAVFDSPGKNFRHNIYPEYKANRGPMPDDLAPQIDPLFECIQALKIPLIKKEGYEADDLIGTLAKKAASEGYKVIVFSGDKDFAQLISENITQLIPQKNNKNLMLDRKGVFKKFGVHPHQIIDFLALMGDSSDNVPGVNGCGPKTASDWLYKYGNLEEVLENADKITGRGSQNLPDSKKWLKTAKKLVTIKTDIELNYSINSLAKKTPDFAKVKELYKKLELESLLKKISISEAPNEIEKSPKHDLKRDKTKPIYQTINNVKQLENLLLSVQEANITAIDTETTSLDSMNAKLVGVSLSTKYKRAFYIPINHSTKDPQLNENVVLRLMKNWLENPEKFKVGQNIKYDMHIFANHGIKIQGVIHDTLLASYVIESHKSHKLDNLAEEKLGEITIKYEDIVGKGKNQINFANVAIENATTYAAEDADITLRLHQHFSESLKTNNALNYIYEKIEIPLIGILLDMEKYGVLVDHNLLHKQSISISEKLSVLQKKVHHLANKEFNLSSTKQLREVLFNEKSLPILKTTPKGEPSTDESVLQQLAQDHPIADSLLEFRRLSKLKTTYTDKLPNMINKATGRVHTNYGQAIAVTGRLSSSNPNLQNIPIKTAEGRKIREAFIAPNGYSLISADYSQIELRIMAHLSQDQSLLKAFINHEDIHRHTASELYGVPQSDISKEHRRHAKVINFGLIYGMGNFGLAKQLNIDITEAKNYIDRYFSRYPGVKRYMDETKQKASQNGFVETVFGRRLYLPDIKGKGARRKAAEREAINAPMQGTAADLIKLAMIKVNTWLLDNSMRTRMIMQVHDELVLEVPEKEVSAIKANLAELMTNIPGLSVPLVVDIGQGRNWDEAH